MGTSVQHALPRLIETGDSVQKQIAARVGDNLRGLEDLVPDNSAAQILRVEGGWYATVRVPRTKSEEQWCLELLEQDRVLVQPGFFYDFESEAYLVVSLLTAPEIFREGLPRIAAAVACS